MTNIARRKHTIELDIKTPEADDADRQLGPLFSLDEKLAETHARTRVYREEPIEEGHLGNLPADADEGSILRKWGGGTFQLQAINEKGKIIAQRTVKIAGEPRFGSVTSRRQYERWAKDRGLDSEPNAGDSTDQVALEEARHQREIARIRAEADAAVQRAKAEVDAREAAEERRRAREREERRAEREETEAKEESRWRRELEERRREREEREAAEERRWRAELEEKRAEREARGDPMNQFAAMAQLIVGLQGAAGGGGGGDFPDAGTAIAARLPEIINGVRDLGRDVVTVKALENSGGGGGGEYNAERDVLLQDQLAAKAKRAYANLKRFGKSDAEIQSILGKSFDMLATARIQAAAQAKPAPKPAAKTAKAKARGPKPSPTPPAAA